MSSLAHSATRAVRNECYSVIRTRRRDIIVAVDAPLPENVAGTIGRPKDWLAGAATAAAQ